MKLPRLMHDAEAEKVIAEVEEHHRQVLKHVRDLLKRQTELMAESFRHADGAVRRRR